MPYLPHQPQRQVPAAAAVATRGGGGGSGGGRGGDELGWMSSASTAHVLAFSTIMLNTDAHNPAMRGRDKMTLDQFVRNNRGIDGGKDVPRHVLERLYSDIRRSRPCNSRPYF